MLDGRGIVLVMDANGELKITGPGAESGNDGRRAVPGAPENVLEEKITLRVN